MLGCFIAISALWRIVLGRSLDVGQPLLSTEVLHPYFGISMFSRWRSLPIFCGTGSFLLSFCFVLLISTSSLVTGLLKPLIYQLCLFESIFIFRAKL
jgi:hypothetical protein